jgi:hypothetical protein
MPAALAEGEKARNEAERDRATATFFKLMLDRLQLE